MSMGYYNIDGTPFEGSTTDWALKFDMTRALKEKMDSEGISIPYPQQTVHMIQQSGA